MFIESPLMFLICCALALFSVIMALSFMLDGVKALCQRKHWAKLLVLATFMEAALLWYRLSHF